MDLLKRGRDMECKIEDAPVVGTGKDTVKIELTKGQCQSLVDYIELNLFDVEDGGVTMREIVFRGSTVIGGAWVCGDLVYTTTGKAPMIRIHGENCASNYTVLPETLGQYTGLTDKNGKRIFEGDIMSCDRYSYPVPRRNYVILWKTESACFSLYDPKYDQHIMIENIPYLDAFVIGNIYDNPELLEVQHE